MIARARHAQPPRSKDDARKWRDTLRTEIRAGTFIDPGTPPPVAEPTPQGVTFGDVCDDYIKKHVAVPTRRANALKQITWTVKALRATAIPAGGGATVTLETKLLTAITKADVEAIRDGRRAAVQRVRDRLDAWRIDAQAAEDARRPAPPRPDVREPGVRAGEVQTNRLLARLRHIFSWAIEQGYLEQTPFKRGPQTVVKLERAAEHGRDRRLVEGEEERLLQHAGPHLHAVITCALQTGMRRGEILKLQWQHVRCVTQGDTTTPVAITLPASLTKTGKTRTIPVSTRLAAVLDMRRLGPDGQPLGPEAFVFGNEVGEPIASVKTAWRLTTKRAAIEDLHLHDLRREFGCRLLEAGASLNQVRDFLGHSNVTMTDRYLSTTPGHLLDAMRKFEDARPIRTRFAHQAEKAADADAPAKAASTPNPLH